MVISLGFHGDFLGDSPTEGEMFGHIANNLAIWVSENGHMYPSILPAPWLVIGKKLMKWGAKKSGNNNSEGNSSFLGG